MVGGNNIMAKHIYDILVVGNGYDLALGYDTSYEDFYESYRTVLDSETGDKIPLSRHNARQDLIDNYLEYVKKQANNFFVKYTLGLNRVFNKWCDFESELGEIIKTLDYCLDNLVTAEFFKGSYFIKLPNNKSVSNLNIFNYKIIGDWKNFIFTKSPNKDYQLQIVWRDIDVVPTLVNDNEIKNKFRHVLVKHLYDDFLEYKKLFLLYLETFVENDAPQSIPNVAGKIIVSYNYTSMEKLGLNDALQIHGSNKEGNIVLGVNDDIKLNTDGLNKFKKLFQRSTLKNNYAINNLTSGATSIGFYGLSFNVSDSLTLKNLVLSGNKVNYFYYYGKDKDSRDSLIVNLMNMLEPKTYSKMFDDGFIQFINSEEVCG